MIRPCLCREASSAIGSAEFDHDGIDESRARSERSSSVAKPSTLAAKCEREFIHDVRILRPTVYVRHVFEL